MATSPHRPRTDGDTFVTHGRQPWHYSQQAARRSGHREPHMPGVDGQRNRKPFQIGACDASGRSKSYLFSAYLFEFSYYRYNIVSLLSYMLHVQFDRTIDTARARAGQQVLSRRGNFPRAGRRPRPAVHAGRAPGATQQQQQQMDTPAAAVGAVAAAGVALYCCSARQKPSATTTLFLDCGARAAGRRVATELLGASVLSMPGRSTARR
eukprot:COSAG02_NODE_1286_length_13453_cov_2.682342_3_plen_209_part_00